MTKRSDKDHDAQPSGSSKPAASKRRTPIWQVIVLPVVSILVFFLLLEGGLALFGVKPALKTEDPFVGFAANVPLFVPASGPNGTPVMVTAENKLNNFNRQSFPRQKAPGTYRVFCMGGSTTYGRPYNDTTSFAGWLRELLPAADRSKNWEVINAGGVSYASYRVAHLMEELVDYQPDLFVIYTGHNEFLEERTYRQIREIPGVVRSTVALLAKTRTWSAMNSALQTVGLSPEVEQPDRDKLAVEVTAILDRSAGLERYTRDEGLRDNILKHYRVSLERMVALARSVDAEVIFVTPASSLNDCSPFKSEHTAGLDAMGRQQSEQLLQRARAAIREENWPGALEALEAAVELDPHHAELQYLRGQALLALERYGEAEQALRLARDEDVCPLRALTPMHAIVMEVAAEQRVEVVDYVAILEEYMQETKGYGIPGEELFLDHVHPTIEGHEILAVALVEAMAGMGVVELGPDWGEPVIERVAGIISGRVDREAHGQALANLARVLLWAGKTDDAARLAKQAREVALDYKHIAVNSAAILASIHVQNNHPGKALNVLYSTLALAPGAIELHLRLAQTLLGKEFLDLEKAAAHLLLVCQQIPNFDQPWAQYGMAMYYRKRPLPAYDSLATAANINPKNKTALALLKKLQSEEGSDLPPPQRPKLVLETYPTGEPYKIKQLRLNAQNQFVAYGIQVEFYKNGRLKSLLDIEEGRPVDPKFLWSMDGTSLSEKVH